MGLRRIPRLTPRRIITQYASGVPRPAICSGRRWNRLTAPWGPARGKFFKKTQREKNATKKTIKRGKWMIDTQETNKGIVRVVSYTHVTQSTPIQYNIILLLHVYKVSIRRRLFDRIIRVMTYFISRVYKSCVQWCTAEKNSRYTLFQVFEMAYNI